MHSMSNYPRWSGLKHFASVGDIRFTDADQYMDVLKVILDRFDASTVIEY
jgi:hypothetical protein